MDKALEALKKDLGHRYSLRTVDTYLRAFRSFLAYAEKPPFTRQHINGWLDRLIEQGQGKNSVRLAYYALRRGFKANGWPWPMDRMDVPPLPEDAEVSKPAMSEEDVRKLILWARKQGGWERAVIALSTVYALRREELARIRPGDLDLAARRFLVRTAKGGIQREHLVPEGLIPHLGIGGPLPGLTVSVLSTSFRMSCLRAGVMAEPGTGYHSIRRTVDTALWDATKDQYLVWNFIRWKGRRGDMPRHYYAKEALEVDKQIFAVHPFLKVWLE